MLQSLNLEFVAAGADPELRRHGAADARRRSRERERGELILWLAVLLLAAAGRFVATAASAPRCCSATASSSIPSPACLKLLTLTGAAVALIMSTRLLARAGGLKFEFPVLVLLATTGMMMMISANDLIALYVGLELQSLALYVVATFQPRLRALGRGRAQILRPRRAVLGHAALRRVAGLRLHRLDRLRHHRRGGAAVRRQSRARSSASSS